MINATGTMHVCVNVSMCDALSVCGVARGRGFDWRSPVDQPTSIQTSDKYTDILKVYRNPTYNTEILHIVQKSYMIKLY